MGQCISRAEETDSGHRSTTETLGLDPKLPRNPKKSSNRNTVGQDGTAFEKGKKIIEKFKNNDNNPLRTRRFRNKRDTIVVIPEATDGTTDDGDDRFVHEATIRSPPDITSPAGTASTVFTTPASLATPSTLHSHIDSTDKTIPPSETPEHVDALAANRLTESDCKFRSSVFYESLDENGGDTIEQELPVKMFNKDSNESRRRRRIKNVSAYRDEYPNPLTSMGSHDSVQASFTPIKQTSLQSKVSVIKEEGNDAPSDEEDFHDKSFQRRVQRDLSSKNRVSGPLTPVKLKTQWNTSPSSILVREPQSSLKYDSSTASSPLRSVTSIPSSKENVDNTKAVEENLLFNFQKLKLQVAVAEQQEKRNQKVAKIEDRLKDVQGYKDLWGEFQNIQQQVKKVESSHDDDDEEKQENHAPALQVNRDSMEYDLEDDHAVLKSRRKRGTQKSRRSVPRTGEKVSEISSDLKDTSNWIFDFHAEGLITAGTIQDDDSSQGSLSLLSEKGLEAQRRLFAQKRKERKLKKKLQKQSGASVASLSDVDSVVNQDSKSTSSRIRGGDNESTTSSYGDYGPAHRIRRTRSTDHSLTNGVRDSNPSIITDMEVAFRLPEPARIDRSALDSDNYSQVSDLADDQSYALSIGSSHCSRDASSAFSANNDYRVNRRRRKQSSHRPVDMMKYIPSSSRIVGSATISVSERRKAVEARLLSLSQKQDEHSNGNPSQPSKLTQKFEEAAIPLVDEEPKTKVGASMETPDHGLTLPLHLDNDIQQMADEGIEKNSNNIALSATIVDVHELNMTDHDKYTDPDSFLKVDVPTSLSLGSRNGNMESSDQNVFTLSSSENTEPLEAVTCFRDLQSALTVPETSETPSYASVEVLRATTDGSNCNDVIGNVTEDLNQNVNASKERNSLEESSKFVRIQCQQNATSEATRTLKSTKSLVEPINIGCEKPSGEFTAITRLNEFEPIVGDMENATNLVFETDTIGVDCSDSENVACNNLKNDIRPTLLISVPKTEEFESGYFEGTRVGVVEISKEDINQSAHDVVKETVDQDNSFSAPDRHDNRDAIERVNEDELRVQHMKHNVTDQGDGCMFLPDNASGESNVRESSSEQLRLDDNIIPTNIMKYTERDESIEEDAETLDAQESLKLADEVSSRINSVLNKYRVTDMDVPHLALLACRPQHDELNSDDDQPPRLATPNWREKNYY